MLRKTAGHVEQTCAGLTTIDVALENPFFSSENGILFDKTKTTLICYPAGKTGSYEIPGSVRNIGNAAFSRCTGLTSIINHNPVPVEIDAEVFNEVEKTNCVLEVPTGAVDLYQQAEVWGEFQVMAIKGTKIREIPVINAIQIYPNPASESFRIRGIEENTVVTVWDLSGRMVLQQRVNPAEAIEVGYLPKGLYLVNVMGKGGRLMKE